MSRFSTKEEVRVTVDDSGDAIYIRGTMNLATRNKVMGMAGKVNTGSKDTEFDIGEYNTALMVLNILRWEGPGFEGLPCNRENIEELAPNDPLVEKVLAEINARNKSEDASGDGDGNAASPNSLSGGSEPLKASSEDESETTTSISSLPNGSAGPPIRLTDYQHSSLTR